MTVYFFLLTFCEESNDSQECIKDIVNIGPEVVEIYGFRNPH